MKPVMVNQNAIDRLTKAFDRYLDPSDWRRGSNARRVLDSLKEKGVKLSNLLAVARAIDDAAPLSAGPFAPGSIPQTTEGLESLVGGLMNNTGLKEVQANLAEHVNALRKKCPELVQEYQVQFS